MVNKKKKKKKHRGLLLTIILMVLFAIGVGSYGLLHYYLSSFSKNSKAENKNLNTKAVVKNDPVNILLLGVDVGTPGATNKNDPKRTDTMLLINYNPKNSKVTMVSIPRDTLIKINGKNAKINEAHAVSGVNGAIDAVTKLLDVPINYYGKINYDGFDKIIDTIGGIDMPINYRMDYDDTAQNLHIHFKKGTTVHLDGKKAEEFFRWRKNNDGTGFPNGDLDRINQQHLFIEKVMEKLKSPAIITKIPSILNIIPKYAETNMDAEDILKYGLAIAKTDKANITTTTIKGEAKYIDEVSYVVYDESQNKDLLAVLNGDEESSLSNTEVKIEKDKLKVKILNCSTKNGLAAKLSENLKEKGYTDIVTGNGDSRKKSIVYLNPSKGLKSLASTDFNITDAQEVTKEEGYDVIIMLGEDYNIK